MFTKDELKDMRSGIDLKIEKMEALYAEKIKKADEVDWNISAAYQNSIDFISNKIKNLQHLRKKITEEINR